MKIEIKFEEPQDVTTPGLDGTVVLFPFSVKQIHEGALRDEIFHHGVAVSISGTLQAMWGFTRRDPLDYELTKTLFEFARQHVISKVKQGRLDRRESVDLNTNTAPKSNPYDVGKILDPFGATVKVDLSKDSTLPEQTEPSAHQEAKTTEPLELAVSLQRFRADHPAPKKTAFIMMRFLNTPAHDKIIDAIHQVLVPYGIEGLRADDKDYHDDLFPNILTYARGCSFGIAVFERIEADDFNPNVSLEVGYMLALGKPVCLLKDRTLKSLHTDLVGRLYKEFDPQNSEGSIPAVVTKWLKDRNIVQGNTTTGVQRLHKLASISRRAAILEGWDTLEREVREAISKMGLTPPEHPSQFYRFIRASELWDTNLQNTISDLREQRNQVAHTPDVEPSEKDAVAFIHAVEKAISSVSKKKTKA